MLDSSCVRLCSQSSWKFLASAHLIWYINDETHACSQVTSWIACHPIQGSDVATGSYQLIVNVMLQSDPRLDSLSGIHVSCSNVVK